MKSFKNRFLSTSWVRLTTFYALNLRFLWFLPKKNQRVTPQIGRQLLNLTQNVKQITILIEINHQINFKP